MTYIETLGSNAVKVKKILAVADTGKKNSALAEISRALIENSDKIIEANQRPYCCKRERNVRFHAGQTYAQRGQDKGHCFRC